MSKSSRFWWLHGVILLAAAVGCRSNSSYTGGPSGGSQGLPPAGPAGLTGSATSQMYSQGTSGYPGMSSGGMSPGGMSSGGMSSGGQSFAPSGGAPYSPPAPNTSSGLGAPH